MEIPRWAYTLILYAFLLYFAAAALYVYDVDSNARYVNRLIVPSRASDDTCPSPFEKDSARSLLGVQSTFSKLNVQFTYVIALVIMLMVVIGLGVLSFGNTTTVVSAWVSYLIGNDVALKDDELLLTWIVRMFSKLIHAVLYKIPILIVTTADDTIPILFLTFLVCICQVSIYKMQRAVHDITTSDVTSGMKVVENMFKENRFQV